MDHKVKACQASDSSKFVFEAIRVHPKPQKPDIGTKWFEEGQPLFFNLFYINQRADVGVCKV